MTLLEFYESKRPRTYHTNWHHKWICDLLERAYAERKNVIIECPPRHGKSEIANAYAPAWRLEEQFDSMFGLITNSDNLAKKFSVACRNLVTVPLEVDRDAQWKVRGLESLNFSYMGAGIRGNITGHGFDTVIFDDLLKSGQEAKSDTVRESTWENVVSAAINRLTPDGIIVALQARLHQQDTIGKLLELDHLNFLHLHLPATNDSGTEAWFRDGYSGETITFPAYAALWPTRYSRAKLDEIKETVSSYYWMSQYQAEPSMGDLAYFDIERLMEHEDVDCERCWIAVDAANTQTKSGSYTAMVCLGLAGGRLKVISVRRGRWRQDAMADQIVDFYGAMSRYVGIQPEAVIIERAAAGYGLIDHLSDQLPVVPLIPKGSKEERAAAVCYLVNRGRVSVPPSAAWLKDFTEEVGNFPLGNYNDQVDCFVHALSYAARPSEFQSVIQGEAIVGYEQNLLEDIQFREKISMDSELDKLDGGDGGNW
jgi:predicted phage terminase large subunit-like protein